MPDDSVGSAAAIQHGNYGYDIAVIKFMSFGKRRVKCGILFGVARMNELAFVVFLIHALSEAWGMATPKVYALLKTSGALDRYIIPYYDMFRRNVWDAERTLKEKSYYEDSNQIVLNNPGAIRDLLVFDHSYEVVP